MTEIKETERPINERVIDRLKPEITKMLKEMEVTEAAWRYNAVEFYYRDYFVKIRTSCKPRKR